MIVSKCNDPRASVSVVSGREAFTRAAAAAAAAAVGNLRSRQTL